MVIKDVTFSWFEVVLLYKLNHLVPGKEDAYFQK